MKTRKQINAYRKKRYARPEVKIREKQLTEYRRRMAFDRLGGCYCVTPGCGCVEFESNTISHENHDGAAHRKRIGGGGETMCRWVLNATDAELKKANLAVRCIRCNHALSFMSKKELKALVARENKRIRGGK